LADQAASALATLTHHILSIKGSLAAADITPDRLLVDDLGLDSRDLAALADRVREQVGDVDLMPWLGRAVAGAGTVGSLAEHIRAAWAGAAAEGGGQNGQHGGPR
jgi:hypothetical protein